MDMEFVQAIRMYALEQIRTLRRSQRARHQPQAANQEDQHTQCVEQTGGAEINVQVGENAHENNRCASHGQQPAEYGTPIEEEEANPEQQGQER